MKYTLTFNASGGSCSETGRTLSYQQAVGTLPTPTRDYDTFDGWYTATSGGTKISASTVLTPPVNTAVYAHWTQKGTQWALFVLVSLLLSCICTMTAGAAPFSDVDPDAWYAESVQYVSENGLMLGLGNDSFDPDGRISWGMLVTILYRMEGAPTVSGSTTFKNKVQ